VLVVQTQIKRFSTNTNIENPEFRDCIDLSYSTRSLSDWLSCSSCSHLPAQEWRKPYTVAHSRAWL